MILLPEWVESRSTSTPRRRPSRGLPPASMLSAEPNDDAEFGTLLVNEANALRDVLRVGETIRGVIRGSADDEVYLWVVTPRRVLQLLHGRCQVALFRELARTDLRAMRLRVDGTLASIELSTRRRTYALNRVPVEAALAFAQQLDVDVVLSSA